MLLGSKQVVTLSRLPLLASLTEPEMVVSNKRLLPVGAVKIAPVRGIENVSSVLFSALAEAELPVGLR